MAQSAAPTSSNTVTTSKSGTTTESIGSLAQAAATQLGWNPQFIADQWALETGNFSSNLFLNYNNPAGIKWYPGMTYGTKGPAAPDGGYYANFSNPVTGYVNFVKSNPRYSNVSSSSTVAGEAALIKSDGWATDPNYVSKITGVNANLNAQITSAGIANGSTATAISGTGPTGNLLTNFSGYMQAFLGVAAGIGIVLLGVWVALNPFSDLTTAFGGLSQAITEAAQQKAKKPLEGTTNRVKLATNKINKKPSNVKPMKRVSSTGKAGNPGKMNMKYVR